MSRVEQFSCDYSRFDDTSYIGQLNSKGVVDDVPDELLDMLEFARQIYDDSEGAFNISIGGLLHDRGYGSQQRRAPVWPDPWPAIVIDDHHITIPHDMTLDLGGFGKGWLIDQVAELCEKQQLHYIINAGGDLRINSDQPIELGLEDPNDPARLARTVTMTRGAVAASSRAKRRWQMAGTNYSHIVTPSGDEPTALAGSYVIAETALVADSLATIALLRPDLVKKLTHAYDAQIDLVAI